ncbi:hypothetical protein Scep_010043 [Stephania cephalantha]|uniref:Uncharacterized protein n=1 Tax=Stephania cephalantha TaxID=152367 RepID=A0AAP0PDQ1_9MAGN
MTRRPADRIPTDADLDGQPSIGPGGGRAPAERGREPLRGQGLSGKGRAASGDRGLLREYRMGPIIFGARPRSSTSKAQWSTLAASSSAPSSTSSLSSTSGRKRMRHAPYCLRRLHRTESEKEGPGTGYSKHTGGSQSFWTHALDKDEDDDVTLNNVLLHVHTKDHNKTELMRRCEEHTQATLD